MRHYECECLKCGRKAQIAFQCEPYPEIGKAFVRFCLEHRGKTAPRPQIPECTPKYIARVLLDEIGE